MTRHHLVTWLLLAHSCFIVASTGVWMTSFWTASTHLLAWLLLANPCWTATSVMMDLEAPMTSSWLEGDWSTENVFPEEVTQDKFSGCICRFKSHQHVVCYGATTCFTFPRTIFIPEDMTDLRLKTTAVTELAVGDLERFTHLTNLEIDANFHLNSVEPGVFVNMSRLGNLSISFNSELKYLDADTFKGLKSLKRLRLIKNGFQNILDVSRTLSPNVLPKLQGLSLSENVFKTINEDSFAMLKGTAINELDLILCQIEDIHPASLKPFNQLQKLRLGENLLTEEMLELLLKDMLSERVPLTLLNLYELGFRKGSKLTSLLKVISELKVRHLILRRNHIESLHEGLFPHMPHLEILDLRQVSALEIEPETLSQSLMPQLQVLLLGGNKLSGVMPGVLLQQLYELDLSVNSGNNLFPSYFDVNSNVFQNMSKLESLNLSYNRIAVISNITFNGVNNLKILGLKNATIFYIARNSFSMLKQLFLLNLEDNPFHPFNYFQESIFDGLENLEILLLSGCKITHFSKTDIFQPLTRLKYLSLSHNDLIQIHPAVLEPLPSLLGLDLSWNQLRPWMYPMFRGNPKLRILLLSYNRLTNLGLAMVDELWTLARLDLAFNPFVCDCVWENSVNLSSVLDPSNLCVSPEEWRDKPVLQFVEQAEEICEPEIKPRFIYWYVSAGFLAAVVTAFAALCYFYRWHIRYWIFLARMTCIRHYGLFRPRRQPNQDDYKYDAFISYSHQDRNFIVRLVAMLENHEPYLKLCVYERDFEIGTIISETVMDKVAASRRTLLIVSDAFAKSQWCMWELHLAEYHRLFFKNQEKHPSCDDSLIMIKLGPVSNAHITPTLRYLLKTRIYLEWNPDYKKQKIFWERLRKCLAPSTKKSDLQKNTLE